MAAEGGPTSFDGMSVESMYASIIGSNGADVSAKGNALVDAKDKIQSIGDDLKAHVGRTKWVGEGGDAFREWGDAFAKQIIKLAHVAGVTGDHMVHAGDAIKAAAETMRKEAPAGSMGMCFADADKEKARIKEMEDLKEKVLPQLRTAASACRVAASDIGGLEAPQFRPMPADVAPTPGIEDWSVPYESSGGTSTEGSGGAGALGASGVGGPRADGSSTGGQSSGAAHSGTAQHQVHVPAHSGSDDGSPSSPTPAHDNNTGTRVDSTTTVPQPPSPTNPSGPSTPSSPGPSHHGGPVSVPPVPPPSTSRDTGATRKTPGDRGRGGPEPRPTLPGSMGKTGSPGGPGRIGGQGNLKVPPVPRADTGVIGGMPSPGQQGPVSAKGGPRGTVIGGESQQTGRGMMGPGGAPGGMGSSPVRGYGGAARRVASQPGGVVDAPSGSRGNRREFTPGGSGLVRGGNAAGGNAMGPAQGAQRSAAKNRGRNDRPGYLTEDEETWSTGGPDSVPPVIQ